MPLVTVTLRTGNFVLIEILWSVGRNVKVKRALLAEIVTALPADSGQASMPWVRPIGLFG